MDKYSKMLFALAAVTICLVVCGDLLYTKYLASGKRYSAVVAAAPVA